MSVRIKGKKKLLNFMVAREPGREKENARMPELHTPNCIMQGGELEVVVSGARRGVGEEILQYVEREDGCRFENRMNGMNGTQQ